MTRTQLFLGLGVAAALVVVFVFTGGMDSVGSGRGQGSIKLLAPTIDASGMQVLTLGSYQVQWSAEGVENLVVAVKRGMSETNVVETKPIPAALGEYTITIPPVPPTDEKYRIYIYSNNDTMDQSNPFLIQ